MTVKGHEAIDFNHVSYSVNNLTILKDITGSFTQGEVTSLVGPSGAGKTTLFLLCNGLKSPDNGDIFVLDQNITNYAPVTLRRTVGIALQQATMIQGSVKKNLELPLTLQDQKMTEDTAVDLLERVGLDSGDLYKNSRDLSGGQRQRLSIARTLVNQPDILLLDEITSSLDLAAEENIEQLIATLNQTHGTTIIWITHSMEQALRVSNYTWVMIEGELAESGTSDVLKHPRNDRVERFLRGEMQ